ncbi:type I-E CRISPR-associated protein Cas7/Cse4/CasC [Anaerococcus murdochii]|uniref:type I-E CRISPR-associated protein Cas7/Cse4/CasC n=1 Tax=Anaerococcus murdochii TaxID=411577 RepID=UPI0032B59C2A
MQNKINNRLFLDIHAIQTVPPANINRDDTGSPKTAQYGGVTRARVSSQSWKSVMRKYFIDRIDNIGFRTLKLAEGLAKAIQLEDSSKSYEESLEISKELLKACVFKNKGKTTKVFELNEKDELSALFFVSKLQFKELAKLALSGDYDYKKVKNILKKDTSVDIALFGRMLAQDPSLNEDASAQVAHAISTHAIQSEFDYFTAIDDLTPEEKTGAAMIDTTEYNSSTLYRYANIAIHQFYEQLGEKRETIKYTELFLEAFVKTMPTGKIKAFANQTLPQAVVVSLRSDRPLNMVSAFEEPIKSDNGYVDKSIEKLFAEYTKYDKILDKPIFTAYLILGDTEVDEIGKSEASLNDLLEDLGKEIEKNIEA